MKNLYPAIIIWITLLLVPFLGFSKTTETPAKQADGLILKSPDQKMELWLEPVQQGRGEERAADFEGGWIGGGGTVHCQCVVGVIGNYG